MVQGPISLTHYIHVGESVKKAYEDAYCQLYKLMNVSLRSRLA